MATAQQKSLLPTLTGGQNDGGVSEYEREQTKIKAEMAARTAVGPAKTNAAPTGIPPAPEAPPAPRPPAPDPEMYWVNPYGQVLSTRKGPAALVLTVTNECTPRQLDAIVRLLNDNQELAQRG